MTCKELVDFLMDYLGGELPENERAVFAQHLEICPPCLAYLNSYQETVALGKQACGSDEGLLEDCPEELVNAILAARQASS